MDCAISAKTKKKSVSCIEKTDLVSIVKILTNLNLQKLKKEQLKKIIIKLTGKQEEEWSKIKSLSNDLKDKLKSVTFKLKTKNKLDGFWFLDNIQIDNIMKQYLTHINNNYFIYLGTFSSNEIRQRKINLINKYINDNKSVGIIMNTDLLSGNGLHWISIYITNNSINYFDSNGMMPNKHISYFLSNFKQPLFINTHKFQFHKGTCGLWAINFLMQKAINKNLTENLNDNQVNDLRKIYFRN